MPDFGGSYHRHFDVLRADTPDLLDLAYRLRYQVYCVENQFEDPARCSDRREIDEDDDRSVHILLIHRRTGVVAGTARLILPRPEIGRLLPIQRILRDAESPTLLQALRRAGEVSRFAAAKEFRRRRSEARFVDTGFADPLSCPDGAERRLMPHITLGLIRGILGICLEYQITLLAAVMEPALLRILARLGLHFERLGPLVQYHGLRQPCAAEITELICSAREQSGPLWQYVEADVAAIAPALPFAVSDAR
jgi:N-acyl amino acid synthase of PEP-CTERM/exosortase system